MNDGIYNDISILNESNVELMHTRHYPGNNKDSGYGLGWIIKDKLFKKKKKKKKKK